VHADDPEYSDYESIHDLPTHRMAEVQRFFEDYKALENKKVIVEKFLDRPEALKVLEEAMKFYLASPNIQGK
jgi:inorganic pyrophosphatase